MSYQQDNYSEQNPYAAVSTPTSAAPRTATKPQGKLPVFCLVVFIIDLVFLALRGLLVLFGIVGLWMANDDQMVVQTGWAEVGTGAAMFLFGLPGDIGMLCKKGWGIPLGYLKVAATIGSLAVGIWQSTFIMEQFVEGSPEQIGAYIGVGVTSCLRIALAILYVFALVSFSKWLRTQSDLGF